jgi:hypothetical protein
MGGNTLVRLSQNKEETNIMIILIRILYQPLYSIQSDTDPTRCSKKCRKFCNKNYN